MLSCTAAMGAFFGANALLFCVFHLVRFLTPPPAIKSDVLESTKQSKEKKELSKPFIGSTECFTNLTTELFRTSLILLLTYVCEFHPFFEHSGKEYSRDLFAFVLILFFAYALYTIKPIHDLTLLGREQTEEWKGWMQFIFLLYHYFHAEEVYNSVRVMITCYVWMTGFGNFSFFYIKQDYGWLRVVQMLWRLNFSVLLLMCTHGNTYILYYICPMHTFYFFMVYFTMYLFNSVNYLKYGIRIKLFIVGILIYIIWDINHGIFDTLFFWLGTSSVIGAKRGSVWEYYFRTSLDHYSSFFGMIFALNFPLAEQYFTKAKGTPLILCAILMLGVTVWWCGWIYSQEKLAYNLTHSYTAVIPLTSYIFFRNLTPYIRSGVSMSLHDLGKTTLETYLLQHHIWLTSNAKTLLTIIPNHPWINFAFATILFFTVSKELYRLTMSLRGMLIPDDESIAYRNIIGMAAVVALVSVIGLGCSQLDATPLDLCIVAIALSITTLLTIRSSYRSLLDNSVFNVVSHRFVVLGSVLICAGSAYSALYTHTQPAQSVYFKTATPFNLKSCVAAASKGQWFRQSCPVEIISTSTAHCKLKRWEWPTSECPLSQITTVKLRNIIRNKRVTFIGDSVVRKTYHQFNLLFDSEYASSIAKSKKHSDLSVEHVRENTTISFKWAPYANNITNYLLANGDGVLSHDILLLGIGPWDALREQNIHAFTFKLKQLSIALAKYQGFSIWMLPTPIIDELLPTQEKQLYMSQEQMLKYRQAIEVSDVPKKTKVLLDPTNTVVTMEAGLSDGLHYSDEVYDAIVQIALNTYTLHFPTVMKSSKPSKPVLGPQQTGSMSFPIYGGITLLLAFVMLFFMDSFLGLGFISLVAFNRSYDWKEAYYPLHMKIGGMSEKAPAGEQGNGDELKSFIVDDSKVKHLNHLASSAGEDIKSV